MLLLLNLLVIAVYTAAAQKLDGLGVAGGSGPSGGIGDNNNPVKEPQAFITDRFFNDSSRKLESFDTPQLVVGSVNDGNTWNVDVDGSKNGARQEMVGFGHAWTDSTVDVFNTLDDSTLDKLMKELFSQDGNNMGFMRHTIGSSDLSGEEYSYDENNGNDDPNLDNFDLGTYGTAMAKMISKMGEYKSDVSLVGSPWSAPGWMKNNKKFVAPNLNGDGQYNIPNNSLAVKNHKVYAEYLAKYVDAFKKYNVSVNAITPENEPLNYQGGYPTMHLNACDEANLISKYLGELMKDRDVSIWAYDHNTDQPAYPMTVMETAEDYVQGTAWHCYQSPIANYSILSDFHNSYPDKLQFMSECGSNAKEFGIASNFIQPSNNWASGGTQWVLATNDDYGPHSSTGGCENCLGSIIVHSNGTYTKTQNYYMMGHFSRFIRRGSVNYQVTQGNTGTDLDQHQFYTMAVKNPDSSWVIELMNNYDQEKNVVVSITNDQGSKTSYTGSVPQYSLVTWLLPNNETSSLKALGNITIPHLTIAKHQHNDQEHFQTATISID